jgi:N-acyl-D-aspartate/D-glutamate deacylase
MSVDLPFVEILAAAAQRPIVHNLVAAAPTDPKFHRGTLDWLQRCRSKGLPIFGQGFTARSGFAFTMENWNLWDASPAWRELTTGSHEQKLAKMKNRELRAAVAREIEEADRRMLLSQAISGPLPTLIVQHANDQPELEHYVGKSVGQISHDENKTPLDVLLDLSIAGDLKVEFLGPSLGTNAGYTAEIINNSPYTFPGFSDGGAHTKFFNGGSFTTDFLRWLVRDER